MPLLPQVTPEMQTRYLQRRAEDIGTISTAIATRDFDTIRKIRHHFRGNASMFGHDDLSAIGHMLEVAALRNDPHATSASLEDFRSWLLKHSAG